MDLTSLIALIMGNRGVTSVPRGKYESDTKSGPGRRRRVAREKGRFYGHKLARKAHEGKLGRDTRGH